MTARVPDITVVVAAYNAMPELTHALESVVSQAGGPYAIELVVVDDASTDDTWDEIRRFEARYPDIVRPVRLEEQSGSPARPRNVALDRARGEYVLFLDADDWLGDEAIARMLDHARQWSSDVMLVKVCGENGRKAPRSMFKKTRAHVSAWRSRVFWSLGPWKLFRRQLLEEHGLRFFENGMPEDLHVTVPALGEAAVVSIAADYDYYHWAWREAAANTFDGIWRDFDANMRSYRALMRYITKRFNKVERGFVLMRRLLSQDVLFMVRGLDGLPEGERARRAAELRGLFAREYTPIVRLRLAKDVRRELDAVLKRRKGARARGVSE